MQEYEKVLLNTSNSMNVHNKYYIKGQRSESRCHVHSQINIAKKIFCSLREDKQQNYFGSHSISLCVHLKLCDNIYNFVLM